jgi:hypothetical protein
VGSIVSLAPYELVVQAPAVADEPIADQRRYGVWEEVIDAPSVFDPALAQALANEYLFHRIVRAKGVRYTTVFGHLVPGQVQTVSAPAYRLVDTEFMVVEVETSDRTADPRIQRTVSLVDNKYWRSSWRDTYRLWRIKTAGGRALSAGPTSLANVSGELPLTHLQPASTAPRLLGRGSTGTGPWQPIQIGTNLTMNGTTLVVDEWIGLSRGVAISIGNGVSPITTGQKAYLPGIPFDGTIMSVTLVAKESGSLEIDIRKTTYAGAPPSGANSIVGATPPALVAEQKSLDTTLTGWSTTLTAGDVLSFYVTSTSGVITQVTVALLVQET